MSITYQAVGGSGAVVQLVPVDPTWPEDWEAVCQHPNCWWTCDSRYRTDMAGAAESAAQHLTEGHGDQP